MGTSVVRPRSANLPTVHVIYTRCDRIRGGTHACIEVLLYVYELGRHFFLVADLHAHDTVIRLYGLVVRVLGFC